MIKTFLRTDKEFLNHTGVGTTTIQTMERRFDSVERSKNIMRQSLKRGDIISIDFGVNVGCEKSGLRPAIVVSDSDLNDKLENIVVAPLSSIVNKMKNLQEGEMVQPKKSQFIMAKGYYKQLNSTSVVQLEDIRSVSKKRINNFIGRLSPQSMEEMQECLRSMFGL